MYRTRIRRTEARLARLAVAATLASTSSACQRAPEPDASKEPARTETSARPKVLGGAPAAGPGEIAWDVPAAWKKADNPTGMRLFTYTIPKAGGDAEDGELSISRVGGTAEANVERWSGQFERTAADAVKRQERTVHDLKVTTVEIHGTFSGGGMPGMPAGAPKPNYALLGAIVELAPANAGPSGHAAPYFFKLIGPEKTVNAAKHDFDTLVESFRPK